MTRKFRVVSGKQQELKFLHGGYMTGVYTTTAPVDAVAVEVEYRPNPQGVTPRLELLGVRWEHADGSWTADGLA